MNIRNLIHSLQLDEVNQTWPPDMIPGHIQRILVDQEMVQNVQEMSRRSRKCVMGLWTFVWRSMKCVNRYRKWLQSSGVVWAKPIPTGSHVVATTTLVAIDQINCVSSTSRGPREVQNCGWWLQKLTWGLASWGEVLYANSMEAKIHFDEKIFATRGAAHTICTVNGDQGCGSHNVATSWDWGGVGGGDGGILIIQPVNCRPEPWLNLSLHSR